MTSIDATGTTADRTSNTTRVGAALRDKTFRSARRHTILVRLFRFVLPLAILASFGVYGLILNTSFGVGSGTFKPGKIEITASDLKMKNPSYFGVTKENGKYEVRAREAAVDLAMTGPVKLEGIDGDLLQANGVKTILKATRGTLDNKKGELELYDGVDVDASNGMRTQLDRAMIYTKEHRVVSRDPVRAQMPTGTLTANSMDFSTDKRVGQFRGNVTLRLTQTPSTTGARPSIGLGGDARQPVDIRAQEFDIDDLKSLADFRGQVVARQGETQLTAPELHVTYEGQASAQAGFDGTPAAPVAQPATSAAPAPTSGAQMSRLIARTGVILTAGTDRRVTADIVDFDVKADTALFTGNVELLQAKNVFRGGRLAVDRKAGKSRLDTPATSPKTPAGRIAATLVQATDPAKSTAAPKAKTAAAPEVASPFGGARGDPSAPTDIEADSLEVNDLTKQAIFRGRVVAKQGDHVIQTAELIAHYSGQTGLMSSSGGDAAAKGVAGAQLTHIETKGGTKINAKDGQEAEGGNARFDLKANQIVMDGPNGVTLRQGSDSTIKGCKLRMNVTSGEAHVENCATAQTAASAPTAAQLSIAAKPGVAPPTQPTDCPPGKMCAIILRPDQLQHAADTRSKSVSGEPGNAPSKAPAKPKTEPVQPQISPSTIYRSN